MYVELKYTQTHRYIHINEWIKLVQIHVYCQKAPNKHSSTILDSNSNLITVSKQLTRQQHGVFVHRLAYVVRLSSQRALIDLQVIALYQYSICRQQVAWGATREGSHKDEEQMQCGVGERGRLPHQNLLVNLSFLQMELQKKT